MFSDGNRCAKARGTYPVLGPQDTCHSYVILNMQKSCLGGRCLSLLRYFLDCRDRQNGDNVMLRENALQVVNVQRLRVKGGN